MSLFDSFNRTIRIFGEDKLLVRPALTLNLYFRQPLPELCPRIANLLELYLKTVPPGSLSAYITAGGVLRPMPARTLSKIISGFRSPSPGLSFEEEHLGQVADGSVGEFAFSFIGGGSDEAPFPERTSWLYMQFPIDFLNTLGAGPFIEFVVSCNEIVQAESGFAGYGFAHLINGPSEGAAMRAATEMAMRLSAFDITYPRLRDFVRAKVPQVSWINLWGPSIVEELGGASNVRAELPKLRVLDTSGGVIVISGEEPAIGDVNRGAGDVDGLRQLARFTRSLRPQVNNLGAADPAFAARWMSRFDEISQR